MQRVFATSLCRPAVMAASPASANDVNPRCVIVKDGEPGLALVVPAFARAAVLSRYHYSSADGMGHSGGETLF